MIGIGIVTYNRPDKYCKILESIQKVDHILSIKDGGKPDYPCHVDICLPDNRGVGACKNILLNQLLNKGFEHIFLLEDDCLVLNNDVWQYCIDFVKETGLLHFNWNDYRFNRWGIGECGRFKVSLCLNTEANFSYFHKTFLEKIRFDENYFNGWEHADLELQAERLGFAPSFGIFVSPYELNNYLKLIDDGESTITNKDEKYHDRILKGRQYFHKKWGKDILDIYNSDLEVMKKNFSEIRKQYADSNSNKHI